MEELYYFNLGILIGIIIIAIMGLIKSWYKSLVLNLTKVDLSDLIYDVADDLNYEIERTYDELTVKIEQVERSLQVEISEIISILDSRLDRFENEINLKLKKADGTV